MVNWETIQILNITNVAVPINIKSVYKLIILFLLGTILMVLFFNPAKGLGPNREPIHLGRESPHT